MTYQLPVTAGRLQAAGLAIVLLALAGSLAHTYRYLWFSDAANWYYFGRTFAQGFSEQALAYGFPLLVAAGTGLVGPLWGWFVNVPVLLLLCALVFRLAQVQMPAATRGHPGWAAAAGFLAIALLVGAGETRFQTLANPYRDALAHARLLGAALLLVRFAEGTPRSWRALVASALCLAFAASTRETSVLALPSFLLFGVLASRARGEGTLAPVGVFAAVFALACVPLLVQNALVSGNPLVPAQAAESYARSGIPVPGVRLRFFSETAGGVLGLLAERWTALGVGVALIGAGAGVWQRNRVLVALCLPLALTHLLFYASYARPVPRYLFVIDVVLWPMVAAGLVGLVARASVALPRDRLATAAAVAGFALALVAVGLRAPATDAVALADFRRMREALQELPAGGLVLAEHPESLALRAFGPLDLEFWARAGADRALSRHEHREAVRARATTSPAAWYVTLDPEREHAPLRELLGSFSRIEAM
ncbi:MAG: hypothetical protein ACR2P8_04545, partial [Myxococcota bacterium]